MLLCEHCGTHNREGTRYCKQCGKPLPQNATAEGLTHCPKCSAPLRPGARFCRMCGAALTPSSSAVRLCPRCGQPLNPKSRFCKSCGYAVAPASTSQNGNCAKCGHPLRPDAPFCLNCGAPVSPLVAPTKLNSLPSVIGRTASGRLLGASTLVDRYVILEQIAKGGMGAIYKAMDKRLGDKIVAIKEMNAAAIASVEREQVIESFRREAELLATLQHPNLVRVTDTFQVEAVHYMVMEYIPGKTLQKLLDESQEPYKEEQVLDWARQLCSVLFYLHSQDPPIIYRDMKPANIMIVEGTDQVKLIDFGIARFYKPGKRKDTIQFGTDGYAPPEQYGKTQTDVRSDVYALGAVLHQLLTLRDPQTVLFQFPPVKDLNPKVSGRVNAAIARAVQLNKDNRPSNIAEFWADLSGGQATELLSSGNQDVTSSEPCADSGTSGSLLDMGHITVGMDVPHGSLRIPLVEGETAKLISETAWLRLEKSMVDSAQQDVRVTLVMASVKLPRLRLQRGTIQKWADLHTRFLVPAPQSLLARVRVERDSGVIDYIPILVHVDPPAWQVTGGWALTVGLMLAEAGLVVGSLAAILVALFNY